MDSVLDPEKTMDSVLDPQKMMDSVGDPEMTMEYAIDPEKTMDYVLFKKVRTDLMFHIESRESMEDVVQLLENQRDSDDDKVLPQLNVVLYKDLVGRAWGWHRLLPWKSGYLLFEDYFGYLRDYFLKNQEDAVARPNLYDVAKKCIEAEEGLTGVMAMNGGLNNLTIATITASSNHVELGKKIKEAAGGIMNLQPASTAVAAGLMCIMEEANLMSELLARCMKKGDKSTIEVCKEKFGFGYKVRQAALEILTTYTGPYRDEFSAVMLGMKKEAIIARELLDQENVNSEDSFVMSEEIRDDLLKLLIIMLESFPKNSGIKYRPISGARAFMKDNIKNLQLCVPRKGSGSADEVSESPVATKSVASVRSPLSWSIKGYDSNDGNKVDSHDGSKATRKRRQDMIIPRTLYGDESNEAEKKKKNKTTTEENQEM